MSYLLIIFTNRSLRYSFRKFGNEHIQSTSDFRWWNNKCYFDNGMLQLDESRKSYQFIASLINHSLFSLSKDTDTLY